MEKYDCDLFDFLFEENYFIVEDKIRGIFQKICIGLKSMHSCGVAHLDIKLENIMIDMNTNIPYIGDFGCCYNFKEKPKCYKTRGTKMYNPPEYANRQHSFDPQKSDIYSLGVTLHVLLTKTYPYDITKDVGRRKICINDRLSDDCKNLLRKMLRDNPKKRISLERVMKHPWLSKVKKESKFRQITNSITNCITESTIFNIF